MNPQEFLTVAAPVAGALLFFVNMIYTRMDRHLEVLQKMANEPAGSKSFQALVEELRLQAFRNVFFPEPLNVRVILALLLLGSGILTLLLSIPFYPDQPDESIRLFGFFVGLGLLYTLAGLLALVPPAKQSKGDEELIRQWLRNEQARVRLLHEHEWKTKQETLNPPTNPPEHPSG